MNEPASESLWLSRGRAGPGQPPRPLGGGHYDVVIVGAGLTGLVSGLLLAKAGRGVLVLEARYVGAGTTGHSTAKVSLLQGTRLSKMGKRQPSEVVQAYVQGSREGQAWLQEYCRQRTVPIQTRTAFTYATTAGGADAIQRELEACRGAGIDARWEDEIELSFPTHGAVYLNEQSQLDPTDLLRTLVADIEEHAGSIQEGARVRAVQTRGARHLVSGEGFEVTADKVIVATGTPILDRGGFFARLEPLRSYAAAFRVPGLPPMGMYLSADLPSRSLRSAPNGYDELLLTGGNGHTVGRDSSPARRVQDLTSWTLKAFPGAIRTHWWSAQDYQAVDELPFVGPLTPVDRGIYVATGYDKWGMTSAVAASLALSARLLGGHIDWAEVWDSWRLRELGSLPRLVSLNASVAAYLAGGWTGAVTRRGTDAPDKGKGFVTRRGTHPVATCNVDGQVHQLTAVCPHLKGIVRWNDAEQSWDCPLHGSRFSADGSLLEGPATRGLRALKPEASGQHGPA